MIEILFILILLLVCLWINIAYYCFILVKKKIKYEEFKMANLDIYCVYSSKVGPLKCFFNKKEAEEYKMGYEKFHINNPEHIEIELLYVEP